MKVEMIHEEPPTPCAAAVSAVAESQNHNNLHQQHDPADDDFGDLGLGCVDDDELLGLGNDFNILEYADPELHDAMDDMMGGGQDDHPGHRSSSSTGNGGAGGADSPSDFNILEYADPGELDGTSTTTTAPGDDVNNQRPSNEQLSPDELSRRKKEAEEKAAKVAQDMNEFQAKLLELTEQKKQQQLKAEAQQQQQQQQQQNAQHQQHQLQQGPDSVGSSPGAQQQQQQQQQQFGAVGGYPQQQAAQPPPPYRGPPPPYPGTPRAPSNSQVSRLFRVICLALVRGCPVGNWLLMRRGGKVERKSLNMFSLFHFLALAVSLILSAAGLRLYCPSRWPKCRWCRWWRCCCPRLFS
jgi:hypothetical protein